MIPNSNNFAFIYKFKNAQCFLNLSFLEKIKDVESDAHITLRVKCVTTIPECEDQYHFAICLDSVGIPFAITSLLDSLEPMPFRREIKELERRIDNNEWKDVNGSSLSWKKLANKIRGLFRDFNVLKGKLKKQNEMSRSRMVTYDSQGKGTNQASKLKTPQQSGGSCRPRNAKKSAKKRRSKKRICKPKHNPRRYQWSRRWRCPRLLNRAMLMRWQVFHTPEQLIRSLITKKLAGSTSHSGQLTRMIDILQLVEPPANFNIRSKENRIVKELVN